MNTGALQQAAHALAAQLRACELPSIEIEDSSAERADDDRGCIACYLRVGEGHWLTQPVDQVGTAVRPDTTCWQRY